jgi:ureidoacrylate peracid hydrolase
MHKVSIPEYAVKVAMGRRGTLRKYPSLDPAKTALLVIDMQNAFLLPEMHFGLPNGLAIMPNINRIVRALRDMGGLVVWIQMDHRKAAEGWDNFFGSFSPAVRERVITELSPGGAGYDIHADLDVQPSDMFVVKTRMSPFVTGSSNLDRILRSKGIDTVLVTGVVTNGCCECTARDAMQLDYKTVFIADANATRTDEEQNATLATMLQTFADIPDTEQTIAALKENARSPAAQAL